MLAALVVSTLLGVGTLVVPEDATVDHELKALEDFSTDELRVLLQGLLKPRKGASSFTHERVRALRTLARADERAADLMNRFPAALVVTIEGADKMEAAAFRSAATRVFREAGLPLVDAAAPAAATLQVHVAFVAPGGRYIESETEADEYQDRKDILKQFAEGTGGKFVAVE